jgi:hypothetical protein
VNSLTAFIQNNIDSLVFGGAVLCIATLAIGFVAFMVISLDAVFDIEGDQL